MSLKKVILSITKEIFWVLTVHVDFSVVICFTKNAVMS